MTSLENGIDTSGNSEQQYEDGEYDQQSSNSGNGSSSLQSLSSYPDELNEGEDMVDENQNTNDRRKKITEFLNRRKYLKLATKTHPEKRKMNCVEEDIQLKKQLIERIDKNDREF